MNKQHILIASIVFISIVLFRLLQIPNFNPTIAMAIICGAFITNKRVAYTLPLISLFVCDFVLAITQNDSSYTHYITSGDFILNYILYLSAVYIGNRINNKVNLTNSLFSSIVSVIFFFIASNFITWIATPLYSHDISGLTTCYISAIPFVGASLLSNTAVMLLFYIAYTFISNKKLTIA